MKITEPAPTRIGAIVDDFSAARATAQDAKLLRELVYRHKLVVLRNQSLTKHDYVGFANVLGTPQVYLQSNYHHPEHPEIFVSSNVLENGQKIGVAGTGRYWHTDCQFLDQPLPMTMVLPQVLPAGLRATYYIDMVQVYRRLPPHLRKIVDGRDAVHEGALRYKVQACDIDRALADLLQEKREFAPPVRHPAVIEHIVTGQPCLYLSSGFTIGLVGMKHEEAQAALNELFEFVEREEHVHTHPWSEGDLLLWDNRCLLHKASATAKGERSVSYRIGVYDGLPFYSRAATNVGDGRGALGYAEQSA